MLTDIACSGAAMWWYGEMDTVFMFALLLLGLYSLKVFDNIKNTNK